MHDTSNAPRRPILSILANVSYRWLFSAGIMVNVGVWAWLLSSNYIVYQITQSPFLAQLNGVAFAVPNLLIGILSGVLADSFDRRRLLQVSYLLNGAVALLFAWMVLKFHVEAWQVMGATLIIGSVNTLDWAARWTLASNVVERRVLPYTMALEASSLMGGQFAGPWLAGALVAIAPLGQVGVAVPLAVIGSLFLAGALLMLRVTPLVPQEFKAFEVRAVWARTVEGLSVVAGNRVVIGTLGIAFLVNAFFYSHTSLIPAFAKDVLRVGPGPMGLLGGAQGMGALVGATYIALQSNIRRNSTYFIVGSLMTLIGLLVFSIARFYPLALGSLFFAGLGLGGFSSMLTTLTLTSVSDEMRGRASGVINLAIGGWPLGLLAVGVLAELRGPSLALICTSATGLAVTALWSYRCKEMRKV